MTLSLSDGSTLLGSTVEVVRILKDQTTNGSFSFTLTPQSGGISVTITPNMADPLEVAIGGADSSFTVGQASALSASAANYSSSVSSSWYENGVLSATGSSFSFTPRPRETRSSPS
jgi:hypothetical protein